MTSVDGAPRIEVEIPVILRDLTGQAKRIEGTGGTLGEVFEDLELRYPGLRDKVIQDGADGAPALRKFVNVYLNDEDVRFLGGLAAPVGDGDTVTVLPAVAGG